MNKINKIAIVLVALILLAGTAIEIPTVMATVIGGNSSHTPNIQQLNITMLR